MDKDWRPVDPKEKIFSGPTDAAAAVPATPQPTTAPTTSAAILRLGPPILITSEGTQYYDGQKSLVVVNHRSGAAIWPLPATASGTAVPHLVRTSDDRLYLFNQGGRILRIRPTPARQTPFEIEATFARDVPDTNDPTKVWLDPAGRIDFEWGKRLTIFFPSGYIPRQIAEKMESGGTGGP
jgi:hypothetical protein